jgi:predicted secreted protein
MDREEADSQRPVRPSLIAVRWTSILAIYVLVWMLCLFVVLPWGVRTSEEAGETVVRGHAESAPHVFSFGRVALRTTVVATILFGLYYANYVYGWITIEDLDWLH